MGDMLLGMDAVAVRFIFRTVAVGLILGFCFIIESYWKP